jgi:O-Antigen ligase
MYLDIVPLPVLLGFGMLGALFVLLIPSRIRLWVFLAGLPLWLALSRFPELGPVQAFSKVSGMFYFGVVAFAALTHPGPKRKIPFILWLYPLLGLLSVFYVLGAEDAAIAVVLRIQWFFLTLAALMVVRTITTEAQLTKVLYCLFLGSTAAGTLAFLAVVKDPGAAFAGGLGRVQPWGANQNHVGPIFVLMTPLGLYFGLRAHTQVTRLIAFGAFGLGGIMALLTASRSVVFPVAGLVLVIGWELRRRPLVIVGAAVAVIPILLFAGGFVADANVDRLGSLETERFERWKEYLGVIMQHPMFGIMFETGELAASAEEVGGHAHNAYLDALRVYGLSLCVPLFALAAWSSWSAFKVWMRRKQFAQDNLLITMLTAFMAMVYFHGVVTIVIYYSNYTWSFFHVFLSSLFITMAASRGHELVPDAQTDWDGGYGYDDDTPPEWSMPYPPEHTAPALASNDDIKQAG